jgi:hypothetical protein
MAGGGVLGQAAHRFDGVPDQHRNDARQHHRPEDGQRRGDAFQPINDESPDPAPLQKQASEVPGDQEEDRHPEDVQGEEGHRHDLAALVVHDDPGLRAGQE